MTIKALLFGSIGAVAETSDIQRRAYNTALQEAGLDWQWDRETYRDLLGWSGGRSRLRLLADATATTLDDSTIESIHTRKTELACAEVIASGSPLRPGVADLVSLALDRGLRLGFVTTTYRPNVDAIAEAAGEQFPLDRFDVVVTTEDVAAGKPASDCYQVALRRLGIEGHEALAIEDTANSALAAIGAGVPVVVTPGELSSGQVIVGAEAVLDSLADEGGQLRKEVLSALDR